MSTYFQSPYVDENNKFKPGVCPNVDTLENIYERDLISKENCLNSCAVSIDECNDVYRTGVSVRKCGSICEKDPSSSPLFPSVAIRPHNNTCRAGQYCKECCIGKCLVDDKTLNMTCFLNCIDDVCTERIFPQQPPSSSSPPLPSNSSIQQPASKPDILIPVTLTTEEPKKKENSDSDAIWIYFLVVAGLVLLGLSIFAVRNFQLKKSLLHVPSPPIYRRFSTKSPHRRS